MKKILLCFLSFMLVFSICSCENKIDSFVLMPLYEEVDMNNLPDGIYNVAFEKEDILIQEIYPPIVNINCEIYSEDLYDTIDLHNLKVGDYVEYSGQKEKLEKIIWNEDQNLMTFNHWDSIEDADIVFRPESEGGIYKLIGPNDHATYTKRGETNIVLSNDCVLRDNSDLDDQDVRVEGAENVSNYIFDNEYLYFNNLNTTFRIEDGLCVDISIRYIP